VAVVLRPGKTPGGVEVRAHLRAWCGISGPGGTIRELRSVATGTMPAGGDELVREQRHRLHLRLSGTKPLARKVDEVADDIRNPTRHREPGCFCAAITETRHKAKSWDRERRTVARIEATMLGLDIRFVVTSLDVGSASGSTTACIARAAKPRI